MMYQSKDDQENLKAQILDIMKEDSIMKEEREHMTKPNTSKKKKKTSKKTRTLLKVTGVLVLVLLVLLGLIIGTRPGRKVIYKAVGSFIANNVDNDNSEEDSRVPREHAAGSREESYVMNYLLFGIEKIGGARNTDSMMIATLNTKDKTIKLTSLLRDSYVEIPGYKPNKLNSAYAKGGIDLLIETIELNYKIQIDGYASVDFDSFESIVDLLGGVTIELGETEAKYLNRTNYISKKENRNVKPGVNHLNGNQVMGYVRVRKVSTLGGVNSDYGRVVRQQRVLKAMFESYVAPSNLLKLASITKECLGYVSTDLKQSQIEQLLEGVVENKITTIDTLRVPVDGAFEAPKKYNGIGYPIIIDWDKNRVELYKFIFGETEEEAKVALSLAN